MYETNDPRATILRKLAQALFAELGSTPFYDTAIAQQREVRARLGHKGVYPNVDFFSDIVYSKLGIPTDVFTPVFAISRVAGYVAHWREQMRDNKRFRPSQVFTGEHGAKYVEIERRK